MDQVNLLEVISIFSKVAKNAGKIILSYHGKVNDMGKKYFTTNPEKDNNKEVLTIADLETQKYILSELFKAFPFFGICSEEEDSEIIELEDKFSHRQQLVADRYTVVIDPIDGTANFLGKSQPENHNKFAVQINLVAGFEIVAGVVYFPVYDLCIMTWKDGPTLINNKVQRLKPKVFLPADPVRISSNYDAEIMSLANLDPLLLKKLFANSPSFGASCYNLYALLTGELYSYILSSIEIIDFGCTALAYKNAGGFIGDNQFQPVEFTDPTKVVRVGQSYYFRGLMILAPTQDYLKSLMNYIYASQQ